MRFLKHISWRTQFVSKVLRAIAREWFNFRWLQTIDFRSHSSGFFQEAKVGFFIILEFMTFAQSLKNQYYYSEKNYSKEIGLNSNRGLQSGRASISFSTRGIIKIDMEIIFIPPGRY